MEAMRGPSTKAIARAAFAAAIMGTLGLAAVAAWLRRGLPFEGADLSERAAYLLKHSRCWTWGWLVCTLGALSVVNLYRALAGRWRSACEERCRLAMVLASAGLAADLSGIAIWMIAAPGIEPENLALVDKLALALSLFVAKILYSLAGLLLVWAGWRELPRGLGLLSLAVWLAGFTVAGKTACDAGSHLLWPLAALVVLFVTWSALLGFHCLRAVAGGGGGASFSPDPRD
jgi:hypothetical protein